MHQYHCLSEKTEVFLEIFGNSEVRSQTEQMLRHMARQLSLSVTNTLADLNNSCLDTTDLRVSHVFGYFVYFESA